MGALPNEIASDIVAKGGGWTNYFENMHPDEGRSFRISSEKPCIMYTKLEWLMHRKESFNNLQYYLHIGFVHKVVVHLCHDKILLPWQWPEWPTLICPPHQVSSSEQDLLDALSLVCIQGRVPCLLEIENCCPQIDHLPRDIWGAVCQNGILTDKRLCPSCSRECNYMRGERGHLEDWDLGVEIEEGRL